MKVTDPKIALEIIAKWCVFLIIFVLPFSKSIVEVCIGVGIIALIVKKIVVKEKMFVDVPLKFPLLLFLLVSCLSFINTEFMALSLRGLITKYTKFVLLYFVIVESINTKSKLNDLLRIAVLSLVVITIDGYIQYYVSHVDLLHDYPSFKYIPDYKIPNYIGFPTASFPYPNDLAAWMLMYLLPCISIVLFGLRSAKTRVMVALLFIPFFYLFVLTKARGAYLGFFGGIPALILCNIKKAAVILLALCALLLAITGIIEKLPSDDSRRIRPLSWDVYSFASVNDRLDMWKNGWKIFAAHPVVGNGINTFFRHYAEVREDEFKHKKGSYAHNCYLQMAAETGLIGLAAFLWMIGTFFFTSTRQVARIREPFYMALGFGLISGIAGYLIHSFLDTNLYSLNLAALFWFSLGLVTAITRVCER